MTDTLSYLILRELNHGPCTGYDLSMTLPYPPHDVVAECNRLLAEKSIRAFTCANGAVVYQCAAGRPKTKATKGKKS